jgi:hypothetical protein
MMHKYRMINEAGQFCSGIFANDDSLAPLHYKGHFIKTYLVCFWIGVGTLTLLCCAATGFFFFMNRNRPGAPAMENTAVKEPLLQP